MYYLKVGAGADAAAYDCIVLWLNEKQIEVHRRFLSDEASHELVDMYKSHDTADASSLDSLSRQTPLIISVFGKTSIYMEAVCATCGGPYAT